jgi:acyl-CoA synthetase (NDP forming)
MTGPPPGRLDGTALVSSLTEPASLVVVGASADPRKSSSRSLTYLRRYGYGGQVWVVNPRHETIAGYPCVATTGDIPAGPLDAAIVNLPAAAVTGALRELDQAGVRTAVVIGSGFEDPASPARRELLGFLAEPARALRVIGPNCVGTMSVASGAHLNFSSVLLTTAPRAGGVALVTQSGATGNGILMSLLRRGAGLSHWFSTGDELDTGALELITGLLPRPEVTSIGLFLEGITDLDWLPRAAQAADRHGKRIFAVKIADSDLGQAAAGGHTGRVVGSSDISRAVLDEAGFTRLDTVAGLADCLVATEIIGPLPRPAAVAGVSVSGASAVILADQVRAAGSLRMAALEPELTARLTDRTGGRIPVGNPLDVPFLGETQTFADLVAMMSAQSGADVVLAVESSLAHDRDILTATLAARPAGAAPVLLTHLSEDDPIPAAQIEALAAARVAVVPTAERAAQAAAYLAAGSGRMPDGPAAGPAPAAIPVAVPAGSARLAGLDAIAALLPPSFPWAPWVTVAGAAAAEAAAARFGLPVAIKAAGRSIAHRAELGAVEVVTSPAQVAAAYARVAAVCRQHDDDVVVQRGVTGGQEVLLAALRDPEYGLAVVLRPGGVLAELLDEQVVLWHGWEPAARERTLARSRLGALLGGYRGQPAVSLSALHGLAELTLSGLAGRDLAFVEFNPVVVLAGEVCVLDAIGAFPGNGDPT